VHQRRRVERQQQAGGGVMTVQLTETRRDLKVNQPVAPAAFVLDVPRETLVHEIHNPIGRPAPAAIGKDLDGKPVSLVSLKGKMVFVNFWAFW
jgi:hypothetical protein